MRLYGAGPFHRELKPALQITKKTHFVIRSGDVIYNKLFAWKGTFGIVPSELDGMFVSDKFPTYELDRSRVDERFLNWYFRWPPLWEEARMMSTGSAALSKLTLNPPKFLLLGMSLPSLAEQRRVVAHLEELAAQIREARPLRQQAGSETASLASANVDAVLNRAGPTVPLVSLESVAESITDGDHLPPPKADSGVPFLFISHVVRGVVDFTNCKYVPMEYFEALAESRVPRRGDVLYTTVGSYGVPCLVDTDQRFCFQRHVALIRPKLDRVSPRYLLWALRSRTVFNQATSLATGSAQLTVPLRGIRMLSVPLPEMTQQLRIVAELDGLRVEMDVLRRLQAESAVKLDALMPAILDQAFKGEL